MSLSVFTFVIYQSRRLKGYCLDTRYLHVKKDQGVYKNFSRYSKLFLFVDIHIVDLTEGQEC